MAITLTLTLTLALTLTLTITQALTLITNSNLSRLVHVEPLVMAAPSYGGPLPFLTAINIGTI